MKGSCSRSKWLVPMLFLISPVVSSAQSLSTPAVTPTPRNDYVVSVSELKMAGKGEKEFQKGTQLLLKQDAAGSIPYFLRAVAQNPTHYRAYYDLGLARYRLGQSADAEQAFQKSIDLTGGGYAPPQFMMGVILCQKQEFQQAETVIQRGLDMDPGSATGKYFLGFAQLALNRLTDAERSARQALLRSANLGPAYFLLARIHQRQGNLAAVIADLESYIQANPKDAGVQQAKLFLQSTRQALNQQASMPLAEALN